jgi:cytoskeletal protein CcmA (bactofilin family)
MGLFSKGGPPADVDEAASLSILASGLELTGDVTVTGMVRIDGVINGSVSGSGEVLVGSAGEVRGDIHAARITIAGKLRGEAVATGGVTVGSRGLVEGNIRAPSLKVEEGAVLRGRLEVARADAPAPGNGLRIHGAPVRGDLLAVPA